MAYNPFNIFRRNQRAIFAVITVFIMFTFVLSSGIGGGADFFDWFPQWLGSKRGRGEVLATIDGKKVYGREVEQVRRQRELAARFMELATGESLRGMQQTLREMAAKASPDVAFFYDAAIRNPQTFAAFPGLTNQMRNNPKATAADKEAADLIDAMTALVQSGGRPFAGVPNQTSRDALTFMLWERKARDLGITFTADDVKPLLDQEFRGQFRNDVPVREALRERTQGFSWAATLDALAAEFRVRTARTALLGPDLTTATLLGGRGDRTLSAHPVFAPPYEVFEFYRDKTSPTTYDVLAVPAANFAAAVPGEPTEDELRRLFEDRKDAEPDPAKEEPGFREPRKVKVEWVSATGDEPYYRNLARAAVGLGPVAAALTPPLAGGWPAVTIAAVGASDPAVRDAYRREVTDRHRTMLQYRWTGSSLYQGEVLDTSVVQPKTLAAAAGGLGQPLATASLTYTAAVAAEQRARIRAGLPLVLAGVPTPGLLPQMVGAEVLVRTALPDPLPIEALRPELVGQMVEAKARELALADLRKLRDEVAKLTDNGKAKDKGPARAYIAEFVKTRGLKTGASAEFQGEHTIGDDPGLAPLRAVLDKPSGLNPHGNLPLAFGRRFFYTQRPSEPGQPPATVPATGTYQPELYPENPGGGLTASGANPDPMFLAWRTAEEPARSLAYQVARPKVVEAWKRMKARDPARAEAERVAAEVRAMPPGTAAEVIRQRLRDAQAQLKAKAADPKAQDRVKLFPIPNVAEIQTGPDLPFSMPGAGGDIRPFGLPQTADLPYPTMDMAKGLLAERTKPAGTALVFADKPKDTYYVAVVTDRQERGPDQFRRAMYGPAEIPGLGLGRSQVKEGLTAEFRAQAYRRAMESVMGIMKREYNYVETDEQKKRLDEAEKRGDEG